MVSIDATYNSTPPSKALYKNRAHLNKFLIYYFTGSCRKRSRVLLVTRVTDVTRVTAFDAMHTMAVVDCAFIFLHCNLIRGHYYIYTVP